MENIKDLSVIIVNYKSEKYLERCLSSLYRAVGDRISLEVIVVNNYPEETLEQVKISFPEVKIIVNPKNSGFGGGNNLGAQKALGEYLWLLNPDTEIIEGSPAQILSKLKSQPDLGAIGACLITEDRKIQEWSTGTEINLWNLIKNNLGFLSSRKIWESQNERECAWVAGTSLFLSKKLFLEIGGFDENIFMYFEDVDLCRRIRQNGKKIVYYPTLKILHKCGASWEGYTKENKRRQKQNYYNSMIYYFKKHRPYVEYLVVKTLRRLFFS